MFTYQPSPAIPPRLVSKVNNAVLVRLDRLAAVHPSVHKGSQRRDGHDDTMLLSPARGRRVQSHASARTLIRW